MIPTTRDMSSPSSSSVAAEPVPYEVTFPPRGRNKRRQLDFKHDLLFALGEFLGTTIFLFLALGGTNFARPPSPPSLCCVFMLVAYDFASPASQYFYVAISQVSVSPQEQHCARLHFCQMAVVGWLQGLALISVAILFIRISGSVFNPAISLSFYLNRSLHFRLLSIPSLFPPGCPSKLRLVMEIVAQITGAIAGTYLLAAVLPSNIVVNPTLVW